MVIHLPTQIIETNGLYRSANNIDSNMGFKFKIERKVGSQERQK